MWHKNLCILLILKALLSGELVFADDINLETIKSKNYYPHIFQTHFLKYEFNKNKYQPPIFELLSAPEGFKLAKNGESSWKPTEANEGESYKVEVKIILIPLILANGENQVKLIEKFYSFHAKVPTTQVLKTKMQGMKLLVKLPKNSHTSFGSKIKELSILVFESEDKSILEKFIIRKVNTSIHTKLSTIPNDFIFMITSPNFPRFARKIKYPFFNRIKSEVYRVNLVTMNNEQIIEGKLMQYSNFGDFVILEDSANYDLSNKEPKKKTDKSIVSLHDHYRESEPVGNIWYGMESYASKAKHVFSYGLVTNLSNTTTLFGLVE